MHKQIQFELIWSVLVSKNSTQKVAIIRIHDQWSVFSHQMFEIYTHIHLYSAFQLIFSSHKSFPLTTKREIKVNEHKFAWLRMKIQLLKSYQEKCDKNYHPQWGFHTFQSHDRRTHQFNFMQNNSQNDWFFVINSILLVECFFFWHFNIQFVKYIV